MTKSSFFVTWLNIYFDSPPLIIFYEKFSSIFLSFLWIYGCFNNVPPKILLIFWLEQCCLLFFFRKIFLQWLGFSLRNPAYFFECVSFHLDHLHKVRQFRKRCHHVYVIKNDSWVCFCCCYCEWDLFPIAITIRALSI